MSISKTYDGIPQEYFTEQALWELSLHDLYTRTRGEMGLKLSTERLESIMTLARSAMNQAVHAAARAAKPSVPKSKPKDE